jgi:4'-phosphopantetheinyl transferase
MTVPLSFPMLLDDAHLWYVRPDTVRDPALLRAYDALQTDDERARGARFVFERHRHQHLVTRALVRTTLSRYAPVAPDAWRFVENAQGRPEIDSPAAARGLRFSLSHSDNLIACLVARDVDVGVDVEDTTRPVEHLAIGGRFFSPAEAAALAALPARQQGARFFQYWTLKESYIKARGLGLSLPLAAFSFRIDGDDIRISFEPTIEDDPAAWRFTQFSIGHHAVATAIRRTGACPIHVRETTPLQG